MAHSATKKTKIERLNELFLEACAAGDAELAHRTAETLLDLMAEDDAVIPEPKIKVITWNSDPAWADYCITVLERHVRTIAYKSTTDEDLRQDCENEARMAIYQIQPSNVREYDKYQSGEMTENQWRTRLLNYCKNTIRNAIFSYLDSPKTGNWSIGRTTRVRTKDGRRVKVHQSARYVSLEQLSASGLQINEQGEATWHVKSEIQAHHAAEDDPEQGGMQWPTEDDD